MASALSVQVCTRNLTDPECSYSSFTVKPPDSEVLITRDSFSARPRHVRPFRFKPLWDVNHVQLKSAYGGPPFRIADDAFPHEVNILLPDGVTIKWARRGMSVLFNFHPDDAIEQRDSDSFELPEGFFEDQTAEGKFIRSIHQRTIRKFALGCFGPTPFNAKCRQLYFKQNPLVLPVPHVDSQDTNPFNPSAFLQYFPEGIKDLCLSPTSTAALTSILDYVNNDGNSVTFAMAERVTQTQADGRQMLFDMKESIKAVNGRFKTLRLQFTDDGLIDMSSVHATLGFEKVVVEGITDIRIRNVLASLIRSTPRIRCLTLTGFESFLCDVIDGMEFERRMVLEDLRLTQSDEKAFGPHNFYDRITKAGCPLKKLSILTWECPGMVYIRETLKTLAQTLEAFTFGSTCDENPKFPTQGRIFPSGMNSLTSVSMINIGSVAQVVLNATTLPKLRRLSIALEDPSACCLDWEKALKLDPFITPQMTNVVVLELSSPMFLPFFKEQEALFPAVRYLNAGSGRMEAIEELIGFNWKLKGLAFVIECYHDHRFAIQFRHSCRVDHFLRNLATQRDPLGRLLHEDLAILNIGARILTGDNGTFEIISSIGWELGIKQFGNLKFLELEGVPHAYRRMWTQLLLIKGIEGHLYEHPQRYFHTETSEDTDEAFEE